jgi:TolB-like protein
VRAVGQELGARYVMEGSVRQAGSTLRIAVQLVDASSGAHLWAETYERSFDAQAVFELRALVPWNRDTWHKSRSAAPGWQGARSEDIGHI